MCDYSLDLVASRPAKVGDKLVTTEFQNSMTRGFAAIGEPNVAVCLLPGTEIAFEDDVAWRNPIIGIAGCRARAASGHAAPAPPSSVMNSRRITRSPRRHGRATAKAP